MNNYIRLLVITWVTIISATSCQVTKTPVRKNTQGNKNIITQRYGTTHVDTPGAPVKTIPIPTPAPVVKNKNPELARQLMPLWQKQITFSTFSGKAKMKFEMRGMKHEVTSNIRIAKDDTIWVNVAALGGVVSVARVLVTRDSLFFINSLEKSVMKLTAETANKLFPVPIDFSTLQNILIGNVINPNGTPTDASDNGGILSLQVENQQMIQNAVFNTDSTLNTLQMELKTGGQREGTMQYTNYETIGDKTFARNRVVNITNNGEPYFLEMNFSGMVFDEPVEFPFSIPKNYTVK